MKTFKDNVLDALSSARVVNGIAMMQLRVENGIQNDFPPIDYLRLAVQCQAAVANYLEDAGEAYLCWEAKETLERLLEYQEAKESHS